MGRVFVDGARYVRLCKGALDEFEVRLNWRVAAQSLSAANRSARNGWTGDYKLLHDDARVSFSVSDQIFTCR
jgi:hypothetical protein